MMVPEDEGVAASLRVAFVAAVLFGLAGVAWAMANPPGAAPDEMAHYTKAVGVSTGHPAGFALGRASVSDLSELRGLDRAAAARRLAELTRVTDTPKLNWQRKTTRTFPVPSRLAIRTRCAVGLGEDPGACLSPLQVAPPPSLVPSYVGTYQPFTYVLPGAAARVADSPEWGIRVGRLAALALCIAFLAAATALTLAGRGGALALAGLATAITPAVVFATATINPSGLEMASGLCFVAALLGTARLGDDARRRAWIAAGASGVVFASCRSFGPLFVLLAVAAAAAVAGGDGVRAALRRPRGIAVGAAVAIAVAAVLNWVWEFSWQPHPGVGLADVRPGIDDAWSHLPSLGKQAVGVFGSLSVVLPAWPYQVWGLLVVVVVGLAAWLGTPRERLVLAGLVGGVLAVVFALAVAVRPTGFGVQARYILPLAGLVPLAAGEVARRHDARLPPVARRAFGVGVIAVAVAVHVEAWYVNATWWAQEKGLALLSATDRFRPPGGWWPWVAFILAAGSGCVLAALAVGLRRRSDTATAQTSESRARG